MKTFRTLDLAIEFHDLADNSKVAGHLRDQLIRASSSVSLNLTEGNAKYSVKEKKRYYQIAYGSLQECKTILKLAKSDDPNLNDSADKLGAWIYKLLKSEIKVQRFS
jgi:four helix bundle protein